jgi:hypothetical protein
LLHKILLGTTLVIYSERGKYFVTSYKNNSVIALQVSWRIIHCCESLQLSVSSYFL